MWSPSLEDEDFSGGGAAGALPCVSVGQKRDGRGFVGFDARAGMKALVRHFATAHGARKIAFVRAPAESVSAQERFRLFIDALKEERLYSGDCERLISSPCGWNEAETAARELHELRGLVPGKDFDALIAASDTMARSVMEYFRKKGFAIPGDCLLGGFGSSGADRASAPALSTVRIPYSDIGAQAYKKLKQLLNSGKTPPDEVLPTVPVFRGSCGCAETPSRMKQTTRAQDGLPPEHAAPKPGAALNALKTELLSVHSSDALVHTLKAFLPRAGIRTCALILHENKDFSKYLGGFDDAPHSGVSSLSSFLFPSKRLLPRELEDDFSRGAFVVQPLTAKTGPLGFIICSCPPGGADFDGAFYEQLRSVVQGALENILLFEEMRRAKNRAEKAEFEKNEFFVNMESELCTPLKDLGAKVAQMERNVNDGLVDPNILGEQLIFLNSQIQAQLKKTETLVELARARISDLPMEKTLFDIRAALPVSVADAISEELPLLYGDPVRLKKAFDTIFEFAQSAVFTRLDLHGIHFHFSAPCVNWSRPEFQLAEKIILLQYGDVEKAEETRISLFWPNLAELPPLRIISDTVSVHSLSAKRDGEVFGKKVEKCTYTFPDDENAVLVWHPDDAPLDEWIKIYSHRNDERMFRAPLLCFSRKLIGHSFSEIFGRKVKAKKTSAVLFVGTKRARFGTWATDANSVSISSMEEFDRILEEINPVLIVFEELGEETIAKVRQHQKTVLTPILVLPDFVLDEENVSLLCSHPRIILCNRGIAESKPFDNRIHALLNGDEILPPHTGALVKQAILYLNRHASSKIIRWKLAETIHVSEDYLTRIFRKEIGLPLWEYLNRHRVSVATHLLRETSSSISEIAEHTGFQDQAYFCRVFKKFCGTSPGTIRSKL